MNTSFIKYHSPLLIILCFTLAAVITTTFTLGDLKPSAEFDYADVLGEGGMTLMTLVWIAFILISRPRGKVTRWLFSGLLLMNISMLLDFMDEFIIYPESGTWITAIESMPAPFGMIIMSIALYHWYQEQMTLNAQLRRTERVYRDHNLTDFITGLYSAKYMKQQIKHQLLYSKNSHKPFTLMMIDICQFDQFNRQHGHQQGDNLLREIGQVITMNIRDKDVACRYASDRFIVLLPDATSDVARKFAEHIENSLANVAFKVGSEQQTHYQKITLCSKEFDGTQSNYQIIEQLNLKMEVTKQQNNSSLSKQVA
ncbi:GGDEF domain-containing protein [Colwellia sp. E2M01]|uniref:GGDEF domain-containing protein n=1 Tax=Colwellia sp. E2M01 TaxID=2841561 RepID=UPI001C0A132E|nr:GGDEF domain-containing protein [Colwellia sp. E2M01]MBU2870060.1 GGDEF domain-containing protein [Colwellia sp. E2M01]